MRVRTFNARWSLHTVLSCVCTTVRENDVNLMTQTKIREPPTRLISRVSSFEVRRVIWHRHPTYPPTMLTKSNVDVLIIGAGPAGLMCANGLARAGVNVRIVDQR